MLIGRSPHAFVARWTQRGAPLLVAAVLTGCVSAEGLHTRATMDDISHIHATRSLADTSLSTAAWPQDRWWRDVGDAQLDQLVEAALRGQPNLRVAQARVRSAQALAVMAGATLYPQVNANAKSMRDRFSEHGTVPPPIAGSWLTVNDASLGASYELDFWGKHHAAIEAALDREHAAELDLQAARLLLTTSLTHAYLRLETAYAQRDLAEATLRQREQTLALTRKRVAAQIDSELELTQSEAALPATRQRVAAINESIALLDNQIAALTGQGPDVGLTVKRPKLAAVQMLQLPSDLPVDLIGRRPDVVGERWRVEAASQDIEVARAQFYPDISLSAFVGLQRLGFDDFLSTGSRVLGIGPAISLPIFEGGRLRGNLGVHQAEYDAAVERYNATVIAAVHDVVDQLVSLHWLQQETSEQVEALRLATRAYDLAKARYRSGLANYLQVLSAESQVLAQQQLLIESQSRQRELRLNLIRALGGGYRPIAAPAAATLAPASLEESKP